MIVDGVDENKEVAVQLQVGEGDFSLLGPRNYGHSTRHYDKPLSCFGCGIGWFLWVSDYYCSVLISVSETPLLKSFWVLWQIFVGVCISSDMVLCYGSLPWEILSQRPQRKIWPCSISNCSKQIITFTFPVQGTLPLCSPVNHDLDWSRLFLQALICSVAILISLLAVFL